MEKVLKKYTTIPDHLYVERDADIQLSSIIKEMQRPGYVLVARQMGKTNLLFNAKRKLENKNRLFVYVDLSNLYDNERDCYRNIINNIIEPNLELLESMFGDIEKIREKNLPPHNEYSRSLRAVLNYFKGDLVIILDEIDALKSVTYSDNIFAQIRSNYFSRTNFPVFERLTYVLSGVIEPTELIKDRNKSPFNIGDKIYLDDFTKHEHNVFIDKSKLKISAEISDAIFDWTNGNPRLTFDICSEVENEIINSNDFNIEKLNEIIKKKYLTSFDIAPIDHIRELVKTNKPIRKSILSIHKNNTSELTDDLKKKLYLYGIINSKFDEETKIKNKIIEQTLTEEWLKSVDKDTEISLVYGLAKYHDRKFEEAIEILEDVLSNKKSNKNDIESSNYFLGMSYYQMNSFDKAIEYFNQSILAESYSSDSKCLLGVCKIVVGEKLEGIDILKEAIKKETNNFAFHSALFNLALNTDDSGESFVLFDKLLESTFKSENENNSELCHLRTLSLYHQSEIHLKSNRIEETIILVKKALEYSTFSESLFLKYFLYNISTEKDESIKTELVNIIVDNELLLDTSRPSPLNFSENLLYYYLDFIFDKSSIALFEKLINYTIISLLPSINKYEIIYKASTINNFNKTNLLNYLVDFENEIKNDLLLIIYKELAFLNTNESVKYFNYFNKYLNLFNQSVTIKSDDIYLFAFGIKLYSESKKINEALDLCKTIDNRVYNISDENLKFESVIIYYWYTNLYYSINDKFNTLKYTDISLNLIESSKRKKTSMIDEKGISTIKEQLLDIKRQFTSLKSILRPTISSKKYGRNDIVKVRYSDGTIKEKKHKQIEADLISGKCEII